MNYENFTYSHNDCYISINCRIEYLLMTINAIENNTQVVTPDGEGFVQITRSKRFLISAGKLCEVEVRLLNGSYNTYRLNELTEVVEETVSYMTKEEFIDEVNSSHTVEELKTVINKMVVQLF